MQTVTVKKAELLETLKKNQAAHRAIFEKAQEGYRRVVIGLLDAAILDAKENKEIITYFNVEAPHDHTEDYRRVIKMLEWSVSDEAELTQIEFSQFVMDNWGWKQDFLSNSCMYVGKG